MAWAAANWAYLDGHALAHGVDLTELPIHRVLNVVFYHQITHAGDADEARKLQEQMSFRLTGTGTPGGRSGTERAEQAMMGAVPQQALHIDDNVPLPVNPEWARRVEAAERRRAKQAAWGEMHDIEDAAGIAETPAPDADGPDV